MTEVNRTGGTGQASGTTAAAIPSRGAEKNTEEYKQVAGDGEQRGPTTWPTT